MERIIPLSNFIIFFFFFGNWVLSLLLLNCLFLLLVLLTFSVSSFQHLYNDIIRCHYLCIYSVWGLDREVFFSLWFDGFLSVLRSILAISLYIFLLYSCFLLLLDLLSQGLSTLPFLPYVFWSLL